MVDSLILLAEAAVGLGKPARAALLWGAALAFDELHKRVEDGENPYSTPAIASTCAAEACAAAWAAGRTLSPDQAIAYAISANE